MSDLTELALWACGELDVDPELARLEAPRADASFRSYRRLSAGEHSWMLCDAPPAREKNAEFVAIAVAMAQAGVRAPRVLAADLQRGWLCLEDLGDRLLLPALNVDSVDAYYGEAMVMLRRLAVCEPADFRLQPYDREALQMELDLFRDWFCARALDRPLNGAALQLFDGLSNTLCERALAQRQVVVHRDFHARNLMLQSDDSLATIDFQDAVIGPLSYDLVSLLRDCYLRWPDERVRDWAMSHRAALDASGFPVPGAADFLIDFDWMGLQRHIKVLGIFCRLWLRDGKTAYLGDLPRVLGYVRDVLAAYPGEPALAAFHDWMERELMADVQRQKWFQP